MPPPSCPLPLGFHGMPFNLDLCKSICFKLFRILLYGVIRTIRPLGPLDGLLGGRFIVTFLSVLCIIVAKGVLIAIVVDLYTVSAASGRLRTTLSGATVIIGLQFIPQLMLALFTTIGFSWSSMKLILYHPETLLLPSGK